MPEENGGTQDLDERKVALIAEILKDGFPGHHVYTTFDAPHLAQFYRIDLGGTGALRHRIRASKEFIDDHTEAEIQELFEDWNVIRRIKGAGPQIVLITNEGVRVL